MIQAILAWFFSPEGAYTLLIAGAFAPAGAAVAAFLLTLPGIRPVVGGACFAAGKAVTLSFTRWMGKKGETLENSLQDLITLAKDEFFRGLDIDDEE